MWCFESGKEIIYEETEKKKKQNTLQRESDRFKHEGNRNTRRWWRMFHKQLHMSLN